MWMNFPRVRDYILLLYQHRAETEQTDRKLSSSVVLSLLSFYHFAKIKKET